MLYVHYKKRLDQLFFPLGQMYSLIPALSRSRAENCLEKFPFEINCLRPLWAGVCLDPREKTLLEEAGEVNRCPTRLLSKLSGADNLWATKYVGLFPTTMDLRQGKMVC